MIWSVNDKNVMGKKPKIVRDKLKDKIINDIWIHFHYMKSVQIRRFFWSLFSCIVTEYGVNCYI